MMISVSVYLEKNFKIHDILSMIWCRWHYRAQLLRSSWPTLYVTACKPGITGELPSKSLCTVFIRIHVGHQSYRVAGNHIHCTVSGEISWYFCCTKHFQRIHWNGYLGFGSCRLELRRRYISTQCIFNMIASLDIFHLHRSELLQKPSNITVDLAVGITVMTIWIQSSSWECRDMLISNINRYHKTNERFAA